MSVFDCFSKQRLDVEPECRAARLPICGATRESAQPCQIHPELTRMANPAITERANSMFEAGMRVPSLFTWL